MTNSKKEDELRDTGIPALMLEQLKGTTYNDEGTDSSHDPESNTQRKTLKKSNNAWNYRKQRNQLSHLIDLPPSKDGEIGTRDISFLHDNIHEKPMEITGDSDAVGVKTLLPNEFQIFRSERVAGLSIRPSNYSTHLAENFGELRVFPSLNPNRRYEAKQLDATFLEMMSQLGVSEPELGPSQMHNLIEIVKKEQNIYDSVFYEIIRQVTVECKERGQLLSKVRKAYADLMARIPRQINSLHCEVIAQRALDRKLTAELIQFKQSIHFLSKELSTVKKQDHRIIKEAESSKEDLRTALDDAAKNSSILQEYHQLYELQRQRLEKHLKALTFERDVWNSTAYSLGLKLIEENELTISRRLYVSERSWSKMGNHFAVLICERDATNLKELEVHAEQWKETALNVEKKLTSQDDESRKKMNDIKAEYDRWHASLTEEYVYRDFTNSRRMKIPTQITNDNLNEDLETIKLKLAVVLQRFGNSDSLSLQDQLSKMSDLTQNWSDVAVEIYSRHRTMQGKKFSQHEVMTGVYENVIKLHNQLTCQTTGENGVTSRIVQMINEVSAWILKLEKAPSEELNETEWLRLLDKLEDWSSVCHVLKDFFGSIKGLESEEKDVLIQDVVKQVSTWLHDTLTGIESENGKLAAMLTSIQNEMLKWMSSALLVLVPDKSNNLVLRKIAIKSQVSVADLILQQESLSQRCIDISDYITKCSHSVVIDQFSDTSAEFTLLDQLKSFQQESLEWEKSSQFLCESIQGPHDGQVINSTDKLHTNNEDLKGEVTLDQVALESENHIRGEEIFILGENENITSRPVSRPSTGSLAEPLTAHSAQALQSLNTISQLQQEILSTEERAQTAEMKIEELEERIRELERNISNSDTDPSSKESEPHRNVPNQLQTTLSQTTIDSNHSATSSSFSAGRTTPNRNKPKAPKKSKRKQ